MGRKVNAPSAVSDEKPTVARRGRRGKGRAIVAEFLVYAKLWTLKGGR